MNKPFNFYENQRRVRDVLTKGQIHWVESEKQKGKVQLIAMISENGSFAGYYPINAPLQDGLKPNTLDDGRLDTMPIVTGG